MSTILYALWLVAFIWGVYTVATSSLALTKKVLWIVLFLILGPIGVLLWYLLGRK